MPGRALIPVRWLEEHMRLHPGRVTATSLTVFLLSMALLGFSLYANLSQAHSANAQICRNVNELRRDIYVTAIDLGIRPSEAQRFLPTKNCEMLP